MKSILFLIVLLTIGCKSSNSEKRDMKVFYYSDGTVRSIKYFKDSLLSGECFWFYPNGRLQFKATYIKGKANGLANYYYESGALQTIKIFKQSKTVGYCVNYYDKAIDLKKSILMYNDSGKLYYMQEFDSNGHFVREKGHL
jgi:antitoxin component YwqK of YwqJK toxin-antitoxin module